MEYVMKPDQLSTHEANLRLFVAVLLILALFSLFPAVAHAQTAADPLPWTTFGCKLATQLTGPWVKWMAVIAIALGGVMFGLGDLSGPFKKVMQIVGGFTIALGAVTVVSTLLPGTAIAAGSC